MLKKSVCYGSAYISGDSHHCEHKAPPQAGLLIGATLVSGVPLHLFN
jgi:hypothetical protein